MKKTYIICFITFVGFCVFIGAYFFARVKFRDDFSEGRFVRSNEETMPVKESVHEAAANDQLICNLTTLVEERYDVNTGILTEEKINTPVELLGLSRDKLIIYMKQYMKELPESEIEEGLIAFELISYSRDKVVWRKTYSKNVDEVEFYGHAENGYVTIYLNDGTTLYDYTNIRIDKLPIRLQEMLENGIKFENAAALYDFLETYTS